jgi:hypothetical protein
MRKSIGFAAAILAATVGTAALAVDVAPATAEVNAQAEALGQCFVRKSTGEDRIAVAKWMLAALASGPQMEGIFKVDPARKVEFDQHMAAVFTRLMAVDCANEARPVIKTNSKAGFEAAGGALGGIAVQELLTNPAATRALEEYTKYIKESDFANVVK